MNLADDGPAALLTSKAAARYKTMPPDLRNEVAERLDLGFPDTADGVTVFEPVPEDPSDRDSLLYRTREPIQRSQLIFHMNALEADAEPKYWWVQYIELTDKERALPWVAEHGSKVRQLVIDIFSYDDYVARTIVAFAV